MKRQYLNQHQACWAQYLLHFLFKWTHKAGATMGKADTLSQREGHAVGVADGNKDMVVIIPEQIKTVTLHGDDSEVKKRIFDALVTRVA